MSISLELWELLRETERALPFLLKQMQAHVPDADVIGLQYDDFTCTWMLMLGEVRLAADGDPLRVISRTAGYSLRDAYDTAVAMALKEQVEGGDV